MNQYNVDSIPKRQLKKIGVKRKQVHDLIPVLTARELATPYDVFSDKYKDIVTQEGRNQIIIFKGSELEIRIKANGGSLTATLKAMAKADKSEIIPRNLEIAKGEKRWHFPKEWLETALKWWINQCINERKVIRKHDIKASK